MIFKLIIIKNIFTQIFMLLIIALYCLCDKINQKPEIQIVSSSNVSGDDLMETQHTNCRITSHQLIADAQATVTRVLTGGCNAKVINERFTYLENILTSRFDELKEIIYKIHEINVENDEIKYFKRLNNEKIQTKSTRQTEINKFNDTIYEITENNGDVRKVFNYYWKVDGVKKKLLNWKTGNSERSSTFYLKDTGYAMFLKFTPKYFPDGTVFVSIGLTMGHMDDQLLWPFSHQLQIEAWYTGQRAEKVPQGLIKIVGIDCVSLDLSYNELTTVSALKNYTSLRELILDNNKLYDLKTLPCLPSLTTLSLNNNKLNDIDNALVKIDNSCPNIEYVSLLGNPGYPDQLTDPENNDEADYDRYRLYVIHVLPKSLKFLDSRPITELERIDARNRGRLLRTVKLNLKPLVASDSQILSTDVNNDVDDDEIDNMNYSPLPSTNRSPYDHKGAYGKCRYRYSGKNSEGNRFIMNNDL